MKIWPVPRNQNCEQQFLFKTPVDEVLAKLQVSHNEAQRWFEIGWVSFDVGQGGEIELPLEYELRFITGLARSGMNDAMVNELLSSLVKPYCYNPDVVAYSFEHGWVSMAEDPVPFEIVEDNVDDWLFFLSEENDTDRLMQLRDSISERLSDMESDDDAESIQ